MSVRQIASTLNLSPSTVSLALRHSPKIPEVTRNRVVEEAKRIGYRPNAKLNELMSHLRMNGVKPGQACFAVISFYDSPRPWEQSQHLKEIYQAMHDRGEELGYRLETLNMQAPGMTVQRFKTILDSRGIQGLLCFGSPKIDEEFPKELDHFAIVTLGLSIRAPLHRVSSHCYNDLTNTLRKVHELGYKRPGLILGRYEEDRSDHAYSSAYLGWCEQNLKSASLPILRIDEVNTPEIEKWVQEEKPDVILFAHHYKMLTPFKEALDSMGLKSSEDIGVAVISHLLHDTHFSGMQQNQKLMGAWAVELLVSRIMNQDFGIPIHPRIEMVESKWIDGETLKSPKA